MRDVVKKLEEGGRISRSALLVRLMALLDRLCGDSSHAIHSLREWIRQHDVAAPIVPLNCIQELQAVAIELRGFLVLSGCEFLPVWSTQPRNTCKTDITNTAPIPASRTDLFGL